MNDETSTGATVSPIERERGGIYRCWNCARRLPVDDVRGSCVAICPKCHKRNQIRSSLVSI